MKRHKQRYYRIIIIPKPFIPRALFESRRASEVVGDEEDEDLVPWCRAETDSAGGGDEFGSFFCGSRDLTWEEVGGCEREE